MLSRLHQMTENNGRSQVPIFGMNFGTRGFLMNGFRPEGLRIANAKAQRINPLVTQVHTSDGGKHERFVFNDVYLYRATHEMAHIDIEIDDEPLVTPASGRHYCCDACRQHGL